MIKGFYKSIDAAFDRFEVIIIETLLSWESQEY